MILFTRATHSILIALLSTILACASRASAEIKIIGETKYQPHSLVRLRAENVNEKSAILWRIYPNRNVQRATSPRGMLEFVAHPGTYDVELLVISKDGDALSVDEARITITIESCMPVPPSPAPPSPAPPSPDKDKKEGRIDPVNAIVRIQFGNAGCTATIMHPKRSDGRYDILTANHCVNGIDDRGVMITSNGKRYPVRVVTRDKSSDVAWLITEDKIEDDLPCAKLAESEPEIGVKVWHKGYGVDKPGNREDGEVAERPNAFAQTRFILSVSSGDSGGGIFRDDNNELVSTVCCTSQMARKASMWGGSVEAIRKLRPRDKVTWEKIEEPLLIRKWTPIDIPIKRFSQYGPAAIIED